MPGPDLVGRTLDRYRIESKLGEGGMGAVYKALDTRLDRVVAIKVLPPDKVSDPELKQRFVREAKAASALNHPNIITVHDVRCDDGVDFIVMEYAEGRTLDQLLPANGLPVTRALRYGAQIADALARAQQAGIVHRDLKPSNVMVTPDERVKVLDFGIAKLIDPDDRAADARTQTASITDVGITVGTTSYMSPEQAEGKQVDSRSDVFSLGALLYELVTGRRAFSGDSRLTILSRIVNDDPIPPGTIARSLSPDVERAILRCLRKDPARRYQTMADLKVALDDLADDSATKQLTQPAIARRTRPQRWVLAALLAATAFAIYFAGSWQRSREPDAGPSTAVPLTALPGVVRFPSFSPDGNQLAFTWTGPLQDNQDIYVQQVGTGRELRLTTSPANDYSPAWSPDGRAIAFLRTAADGRSHELRLIPPLGGPERKVTDIGPRGFLRDVTMTWCPDSSCLILTDSQGDEKPDALFVVSIETGEKRRLTTPSRDDLADTDPALSPDARWLVFRRDVAPFSGRLQIVPLGPDLTPAGNPRALTTILLTAYLPRWISNSEILFSAKRALWRMSIAEGSAPRRLPFVGENGVTPAVSPQPDGMARLAYVRSYADTNIWRLDTPGHGAPAASAPVKAISSTRHDLLADLSADDRRVTFISDRSGESEIWLADVAGTNAVQLTSRRAIPGFPRWSPDGTAVAFHSNAEDRPGGEIYIVSANGGRVRNVTNEPANDTFPAFSHDGQWIYFASTRTGAPFIWKIRLSDATAVQVSRTNSVFALESRDGAFLYYVETGTTNRPGTLWQLPLRGGEPVRLVDGVLANSFDVIDGGIYYMTSVAGDAQIHYYDLASRRSTTVATHLGIVTAVISASTDGRIILFSRTDSAVDDLMLVENFR